MHNDEKVHCTEYREKNDFSTQNDDYFLFVYIYLFLIFFLSVVKIGICAIFIHDEYDYISDNKVWMYIVNQCG